MTRQQPPTDEDDRDAEASYFGLLRAIRVNTAAPDDPNPQPATMPRGALFSNRTQAGADAPAVRRTLQRAREKGHVFAYRDRDGTARVCLTDAESIRALVAEENRRDDPNDDLIAAAVAFAQDRDDDDGVAE